MKATLITVLLLGLPLAAVAQTSRSITPPITVEAVEGSLRLSPEGYRLAASQTVVTWRLASPGLQFVNDSIRFSDASAPFSCSAYAEGQAMRCVSNGGGSGRFGYSLALRDANGRPVALAQPGVYISLD